MKHPPTCIPPTFNGTLAYRIRLYHRGHEIGQPATIHLGSEP
jgi:hypothetical protein